MSPTDSASVPDTDIQAYIDDELDIARRIDVETYLAATPEAATRVMSDLRTRDELRLAFGTLRAAESPQITDLARRLESRFAFRDILRRASRAAALVALIGFGWVAHEVLGPISSTEVIASVAPPYYVEEAVRAHGTTVLRASMASQPGLPDFDPEEIRAATAIVMPELPETWHVSDVQVFPSRFGPSVELAAETGENGLVSLFAVRPGSFAVTPPTLAPGDEASSAYFQVGEVAYVLVGRNDAHALEHAAERLAETLY